MECRGQARKSLCWFTCTLVQGLRDHIKQNHLNPLTVGKPLCQGVFCIYQATMFLNVYFQVLYGVARLPFTQGQSEGQTLIFSHKIAPLKGNLPLSFFTLISSNYPCYNETTKSRKREDFPMKYQEICMEQTHSRSKCKREFKGVLNKVLVSGLILATVLGSSTTAFAANF